MLQDTSWNSSHLWCNVDSETFQSSIVLPIQATDFGFNFLLANFGGLKSLKRSNKRGGGYLGGKFDHGSSLLAVQFLRVSL
jgi:hypothetical protein